MKYLQIPQVENTLDISNKNGLVAELIELAESMIDNYLGDVDFTASTISSERHEFNGVGPYYFKYKPTAITHAGGTSVSWTEGTDYVQDGRRILFKSTIPLENYNNDDFNFIEFTYTKSSVVPANIRTAMYKLVGGMYAQRRLHGVKQFSQGDLSLTKDDGGFGGKSDDIASVKNLLGPFKTVKIFS